MMWDMLEVEDGVQWSSNGSYYDGYIKEIHNDHLVVRQLSVNNEHEVATISIPNSSFDTIGLEIWYEGRGCDNSAIGMSGYYESYTKWIKEAA